MKLRRKKSTITTRVVPQEKPKKITRIARLIYFFILSLIVFYVGMYFINDNMMLKGKGIVVFDTIKVQSPADGLIYYEKDTEENSILKKGSTLFRVVPNPATSTNVSDQYKRLKDTYELKSAMKINRIQRDFLEKTIEEKNYLKSLEIYQSNYKEDEKEDRYKLTKLDVEYEVMREELAFLKRIKNIPSDASVIDISKKVNNHSYIFERKAKNGDIVKKGQVVSIMQNIDDLYIVGYFGQSKLRHLQKGDSVNIIFPDNLEGEGIIDSISTNNKELDFYSDDLIKEDLMLKVTIKPEGKQAFEMWRNYNMMTVRLRKNKWW